MRMTEVSFRSELASSATEASITFSIPDWVKRSRKLGELKPAEPIIILTLKPWVRAWS